MKACLTYGCVHALAWQGCMYTSGCIFTYCPHHTPTHLLDHNNRHAADVLHATFYLLTEPIPEFDHQFHEDGSARIRWVGLENGQGWQLLVRNTKLYVCMLLLEECVVSFGGGNQWYAHCIRMCVCEFFHCKLINHKT